MRPGEPLTLYAIKSLNKGSGVLNITALRDKLMKDYINYIEAQIKYKIFYYKQKDEYIFTFKIPSESNYKYIKPFYYDEIFSFIPANKGQSAGDPTLNSYILTIFANIPSYIFNYCFIMIRDKNVIPWIPRKYYTPLALKQPPDIRNYYQIKSYEKGLYSCYLHILLNRLFDKNVIKEKMTNIMGYSPIFKEFCSQDDKLNEKKIFDKVYKIKDENKAKISKEKFDRFIKSASPEKKDKLLFLTHNA